VSVANAALVAQIDRATDPKSLRQWIKNLDARNMRIEADIARRKLYSALAEANEGTLEHDVWRSIHAFEEALTSERGKTTRLNRTRPKIARVGVHDTVADLINSPKPSEGFKMLVERGMTDLLFESVALRHPDRFDQSTLASARLRLGSIDETT
jgi:hypothetical protein